MDRIQELEKENEQLRAELAHLKSLLLTPLSTPAKWRMTNREKTILGLLLRFEYVSNDMMLQALYDGREPEHAIDCIKISIMKMRRKLADHDLGKIQTQYKTGYFMDAETRRSIHGKLALHHKATGDILAALPEY